MMWRTLQFIPASREKMLNKAQESSADALIFDLEDSVTLDEKEKARNMLKDFLLRFENEKNKDYITIKYHLYHTGRMVLLGNWKRDRYSVRYRKSCLAVKKGGILQCLLKNLKAKCI